MLDLSDFVVLLVLNFLVDMQEVTKQTGKQEEIMQVNHIEI